MLGTVLKTILVLLGCLVAADVIGVLVGTIIDVLPFRFKSAALFYVIWFVAGAFCGFFAFNMAGSWASPATTKDDWSSLPGSRRIGNVILLVSAVILAGLTWLFDRIYWSQGVGGEYYVPDSASHSITFVVAVLAAMLLARFALMPKPGSGAPS
jgi:Na+/citrate or Na+/malate symporter